MSLSSARSAQLLIYLMEQADKRFFSMLKKMLTWEEVRYQISGEIPFTYTLASGHG